MLKSIPCSLNLQCANLTFSIIAITPCVFQSLKMATHCVACILQIGAHILGCPEACLAPYDPATLNRPDIPANVQQLLIIKGSSVWMQGEKFQGEVQQNCVAIAENVAGQIVFIFKLQDLSAMPREQADVFVKLIMEVDHHLPRVVRGKKAGTLNGYMKCTLDRHSCCGGDFGRSKAEREDPDVGRQVLRILKEKVKALRLAFPTAMMDIYSR